jgi:hypothetical protein
MSIAMKKNSTPSQYRQVCPSSGTSPDVLEELKVLRSLESAAPKN